MDHLIIITALQSEAQPFIEHYGLIKQTIMKGLFYYKGETILCFTTGVGKANVAKRLPQFLSFLNFQESIFINIGIAGGNPKTAIVGNLYSINKVKDDNNGREIILPNYLQGADVKSLTTVSKPVFDGGDLYNELVDMEAYAIVEIFIKRKSVEKLYVLKIVSDYMENTVENGGAVTTLISRHLTNISNMIAKVTNQK